MPRTRGAMQYVDERADNACALSLAGLKNSQIKNVFSYLTWTDDSRFKKLDSYTAERVCLLLAAGLPSAAVSRVVDFMYEWEKICPTLSRHQQVEYFISLL